MKAPLYTDILAICQEIANASNTDNDELRLASCKKLQVLCATNQDSPKDHPLQWEALADFTEDGEQAMDIYEVALATAEKLALPVFTASAYLAMALRQVEFEEKEQALIFANKANDVAQSIESEELKTEITELLSQLTQE
ncbi:MULTISPECIES: hypothetical protein [Colwellia]|uniref:Replicative DNA helicase n=1 Tax=Colwellia psychrerythraea (strain 34H / ATCC BAA-681) TaxID=167879 RepID=Q47Z53_COLP3|nr:MULTISPECIES: hypothetical protein [Colwellia]AAZ27364.1 hypothetical protein CPS_3227 [Colwellia psychrerythraea 34H]PKH87090.1 hypothetical protein CXF79_10325 [Colwellia sp. Bg11-28]